MTIVSFPTKINKQIMSRHGFDRYPRSPTRRSVVAVRCQFSVGRRREIVPDRHDFKPLLPEGVNLKIQSLWVLYSVFWWWSPRKWGDTTSKDLWAYPGGCIVQKIVKLESIL